MIGIIGAGISGLSLAYHLQKKGIEYFLLEEKDIPGGYIQTEKNNAYLLEIGPNSLLSDVSTSELLYEIGLKDEIVPANEVNKNRFIYKKGKYRKLPSGPLSLLFSSFFSNHTKWRIITESFRKKEYIENESIAHFFERRFSKEIVDYAVNPFVTGIYAGDPTQLITEQTFPSLIQYEKKYGSVLKGLIKNASERKTSMNFKNGMQSLTRAFASKLQFIHYNSKVQGIEQNETGTFNIITNKNSYICDRIVLSLPTFSAAPLIKKIDPAFSMALDKIYYPPIMAVHSIYKKSDIHYKLDGFGALNPKIEEQFSAGCIWASSVFNNKCAPDEVLITSFVGGSQYADRFKLKDEEIKASVQKELSKNFNIAAPPLLQKIFRWEKSIPQYDQNILAVNECVRQAEKKNIFVCANWYKGISLNDCIKKGEELAENLSI